MGGWAGLLLNEVALRFDWPFSDAKGRDKRSGNDALLKAA